MDTDEQEEQRKKLQRYVALSSFFHAALFLAFFIGSFFAPQPLMILPSVQIDMVALPKMVKNNDAPPVDVSLPVKEKAPAPVEEEKTAPEPPKVKEPEAKAPPKALPKEDFALEQKRQRDAKTRAAEAIKNLREKQKKESQLEEERQRAKLEKRKSDLKAFEQKYREAIAGNQKNEGTSTSGQMGAALNAYVGHITDKIRSNWALPSFLQSQNLSARMVIHIDSRGNVVKMEFTKLSGNALFDNYVEGAVRRSTPFFPPPAEMASGLRNSGIEVKFPL